MIRKMTYELLCTLLREILFINFDGSTIKYKYDNSNDKFGSNNVRTTNCEKLSKTNEESMIEYKLGGCSGENAEIGKQFSFRVKP